jgi:hypothetical protein
MGEHRFAAIAPDRVLAALMLHRTKIYIGGRFGTSMNFLCTAPKMVSGAFRAIILF